jgi:hypothetical protein
MEPTSNKGRTGMDANLMVQLLGAREVSEPLSPAQQQEYDNATERSQAGGMFVRGVSAGGSPFLNFMTRAFGVLTFALVCLIVVGGYYAYRAITGDRTAAVSVASDGTAGCKPGSLPKKDRSQVLGQVAPILNGSVSLPRDTASLRLAQAQSGMQDGNRIDVFSPPGGQMTVQYVGTSERIGRLWVKMDQPRSHCAALEITGFVPRRVDYRLAAGALVLTGPNAGRFFESGGVLRFNEGAGGLVLLQFEPAH